MSAAADMLAEFHEALGDQPGRRNAPLRITLHEEEHSELIEALGETEAYADVPGKPEAEGLAEVREQVARELADIVYVAYGTAHAFAIDLDAALAEVHRAGMSKLDPATMVVRDDGKVLKPPGFVPPDMSEAVGGARTSPTSAVERKA
jgi:predicted HAD superfamily Cof-like phosphohydrolase